MAATPEVVTANEIIQREYPFILKQLGASSRVNSRSSSVFCTTHGI